MKSCQVYTQIREVRAFNIFKEACQKKLGCKCFASLCRAKTSIQFIPFAANLVDHEMAMQSMHQTNVSSKKALLGKEQYNKGPDNPTCIFTNLT